MIFGSYRPRLLGGVPRETNASPRRAAGNGDASEPLRLSLVPGDLAPHSQIPDKTCIIGANRMKKLFQKLLNRETILYLIFGVLTTLVNFIVFDRMNAALGEKYVLVSETVAFVVAVLFAFFTNKPFVFQSKDWSAKTLAREIPTFFGGRILSFLIEAGLVLAARDWFHAGHYALRIGGWSINGLTVAKVPSPSSS